MIETFTKKKNRIKKIFSLLENAYPNVQCPLNYNFSHELLIACLLLDGNQYSKVNNITGRLFGKYHSLIDFAYCNIDSLSNDICQSANYNEKAKNIQDCSINIIENFNGVVPSDVDNLLSLPGVNVEIANFILLEIFNIPKLINDSNIIRVFNLLGFSRSKNNKKIEGNIRALIKNNNWPIFNYLIIKHSENVCYKNNPCCSRCILANVCPSYIV